MLRADEWCHAFLIADLLISQELELLGCEVSWQGLEVLHSVHT